MRKLQGKRAVITGGTSGIGLATAKLFVEEGASVVIMGRRAKELDDASKALGSAATPVQGDVSRLADLDRMFKAVADMGLIDILFANAGMIEGAALSACSEDHFDRHFNINVKGTLYTVQKALPILKDGGSVILTGSITDVKGIPGFGVYAATKAAVRSFARTLTAELKERGIRVNVISPGPIATPMTADLPPEVLKQLVSTVPMGRLGKDEEIAKVALFLGSNDSSYITGIELCADGGTAQV